MHRPPDRYPSPEEVRDRHDALARCLHSERFYANYGLVEPGKEAPVSEPMEILGYACVYPPESGEEMGAYMLIGEIDELPPRKELRRRILGFEVRPGALDYQRPIVEAWKNPIGRHVMSERASELAREHGVPVCCIAFGRTQAEGRSVAFIFHRPEIPSDAALDMIRESVEGTMAQD